MSHIIDLDKYDKDILRELEKDGKKPFSQIAIDLNISNTMVHQRIMHSIGNTQNVIEELKKIPEVTECYHISGRFALYIRIVAKNSQHMRDILYAKIESIEGVQNTESLVDFGCAFKRNAPFYETD